MKEKGYDILKKALSDLPEYNFNSMEVWQEIDNSLTEKYFFLSKEYPEYNLPKDIWTDIEQELDNKRKRTIYLSVLRVAAVIAVLIATGIVFQQYFHNKGKAGSYLYSTETIDNAGIYQNPIKFESDGNDHVQAICQNNPEACNTPMFIELSRQISDITAEMKNLSEKFIENEDPQILRYYYVLENQKVEIELQMLKIINQS